MIQELNYRLPSVRAASESQARGPKHSTSASIFIIVIYQETTLIVSCIYLLFNCVMYHEYTINILYHSIELNTVTNNINATYARRLMGKLGVISSNTERLSCILIGCCIFCCIIWKKNPLNPWNIAAVHTRCWIWSCNNFLYHFYNCTTGNYAARIVCIGCCVGIIKLILHKTQ